VTKPIETGYVVGVDAGGTSTRALAADAAGAVLGTGRAGGANPNSHPPEEAAAQVADAIAAATAGLDPEQGIACVVGMAGASKLTDPAVAAFFEQAWRRVGLEGRVRVASDAEAAFASATSAADGTVLIAGTGSIAGKIRKRRLVANAGGYGWLLGDEGSAYWLGREAIRATLDALGDGDPLKGLPAAVLQQALGIHLPEELPDAERLDVWGRLITRANAEAPVRLAKFAPLVSAADHRGEPGAGEIIDRAAEALVRIALACREPGENTPVVLVGSVLGPTSPVGARVRDALSESDVLTSSDGVLGAAWLAAVEAFGEAAVRPAG
jgi:N-acetylglucosamine kinase-like BadF-type ATPase